jgi:hypothetical protein
MRTRSVFFSLIIAFLALVLVVKWGEIQRPARAASAPNGVPSERQAVSAATQAVTSTFAYQGVLEEDDTPVTGSRQMAFRLYRDEACTTQVGSAQSQSVSVDNGVFAVDLTFNSAHFNGQGLWLETEVAGTVIGCRPIQPSPYALSLRPGALISGTVGSDAQLFQVRSGSNGGDEGEVGAKIGRRSSLGYPVGVYGYAYDFGSVGVWGVSDSQFGWGVNGIAEGTDSIGVRGVANAFSSVTYGVYGEANSPGGYAGYFEHTAATGGGVGLAAVGPTGGIITGTDGTGLSVSASGSVGGDDGIRGEHSTGDGVVGFSDGTSDLDNGVIGFTDGGYGVYGFSNAAGQYAGYFDGPIRAGSCTGCTLAYVARNTSDSALQVGDVVQADGIEPQLAGQEQPVMQVTAAGSTDQVLGVVLGRTEMTMVEAGEDQAKPGPHYGPTGGAAQPGDHLIVVVQGLAQVRVDPAATVQAGDSVGVTSDGAAQAVDASSFGMVMDQADADGLAWVLVGFD